jgi:hypothetical protein
MPLVLGGVEAVSSGCALHSDGTLACSCDSGLDCSGWATSPADAARSFSGVAVSRDSACALDDGGTVHCWGQEYDYDLKAYVDPTPAIAPPFRRIYGDQANYCGVTANKEVYCWGRPLTAWNKTAVKLSP